MTPLDKVREAFYAHNEDSIKDKTLYLAWFEFCKSRPAFHPDDARDPDLGISGWHMLFVAKVVANRPLDEVHYPTFLVNMPYAIGQLRGWHAEDEDRHFLDALDRLDDFFSGMAFYAEELKAVLSDLSDLISFHDGSPEDIFSALSTTYDALYWVNNKN